MATPAQFEGLLRSLDLSGSRERALHAELTRLADELVPEMQRVAGEAGGGSPGPLGWEAEPTTDEALAAYLEDRVDCHAPRADRWGKMAALPVGCWLPSPPSAPSLEASLLRALQGPHGRGAAACGIDSRHHLEQWPR